MSSRFVPSIQATLPAGWFAKESVTLLSSDGQANVIASSEPTDLTVTTHQYAQIQGDLLRSEFPQFLEYEFGPRVVFGGKQGYRRVFSWIPHDGNPVTQIQLYYAASGRGYTATATTPSTQFESHRQLLEGALDGLILSG